MIDLTQLTREQLWGLQFATMQTNAALPEGSEPTTPEAYAEVVFRQACDSYYAQLIQHKTQMALNLFNSLSPEQQEALVAQLQIPDVLPS
jgi:hypothetical protein